MCKKTKNKLKRGQEWPIEKTGFVLLQFQPVLPHQFVYVSVVNYYSERSEYLQQMAQCWSEYNDGGQSTTHLNATK